MAALGFVSALTLGCGNSNVSGNTDFVYTGNNVNPGNTGSVSFQFERLLAHGDAGVSVDVPADTTDLDIAFFDEDGISDSNYVYGDEVAFNTQVTINGVPTSAAFVVITTYDEDGYPISTITNPVEVVAGSNTTQDLHHADSANVTFDGLTISPDPINLVVDGTRQVGVAAQFSNGDTVPAPVADATYESAAPATATVSETGVVTAEAVGETTVSATLDIRGTEQVGTADVVVTAEVDSE